MDVAAPTQKISLDDLNRLVNDAKAHGNSYFGILGGEPFMHPQLLDMFAAHPGLLLPGLHQRPADHGRDRARAARVWATCTPLISIEGSEIVSDERRGRLQVLTTRRSRGSKTAGGTGC